MDSSALKHNLYRLNSLLNRFLQKDKFVVVIFWSGVFGFIIGASHAAWQVGAEGAQVLSGVVKYPTHSPFYFAHMKAWTVLNQLGALFLYVGGAEKTLSIIISGMMGAIYFLAFSIFVFAICQNTFLAISTPFLMHFLALEAEFGVTHSFQIADTVHSHGVLSQGFAFLVIALFCAKKFRIGGFLLGISLSVHPAIGGFLCLTLFLSFLWDYKNLLASFFVALKYFFYGALISGVSLILFIKLSEYIPLPVISESLATKYRYADMLYWNPHIAKISVISIGILIGATSFLFSLALIIFFKKDIPEHMHFPLRILVVAGIIGGMGCVMTRLPYEFFSPLLIASTPSRWSNMNVIGFIPLFIGISAWHKKDPWMQANLAFFISILVLVLTFHPVANWGRMIFGIILFSSLGFIVLLRNYRSNLNLFSSIKLGANISRKILLFVMFFVILGMGAGTFKAWESSHNRLLNWATDPMFKKIHENEGVLLLDPRLLIPAQLYTGRPVLIGYSISFMSYIPALGPLMESTLKGVFGVDIFNPSEEAKNVKDIPGDMVKSLWESRTTREWKEIKEKFGVVTIFTLSDMKLQLPVLYGPEKKSLSSLTISKHNKVREFIAYQIL